MTKPTDAAIAERIRHEPMLGVRLYHLGNAVIHLFETSKRTDPSVTYLLGDLRAVRDEVHEGVACAEH